ncbi:MAG: bifunctional DNA primase/polymerase [Deltaproteobacteria bacterium]|nr:bifunctional DNA primase/polymerase [Deltaproteobacteria bacterium]
MTSPRDRLARARELRDAQVAYTRRRWATIELRPPLGPEIVAASERERRDAAGPRFKGGLGVAIDPLLTLDGRIERVARLRTRYDLDGIGLLQGPQPNGRYHVAFDEDEAGALAALASAHGQTVTPTWTQAARRGRHYVYATGPAHAHLIDVLHSAAGTLHVKLPGLDVLGARRYIVGAPSTHRDGETRYVVVEDRDPQELPAWLWRLIVEAVDRASTPVDHDDPDLSDDEIEKRWPYASRLYRAERLAETRAPAIQGNDGWDTTMLVVGAIVTGLAIGKGDAIDIIERIYSPRCKPEWALDEIKAMVQRATAKPYRRRGWLLAKERPVLCPSPTAAPGASPTAASLATMIMFGNGGSGGSGGSEIGESVGGVPAPLPLLPTTSEITPRITAPSWARAEVYGAGPWGIVYRVLDGAHAGWRPRIARTWPPPTARVRGEWDEIARAVGLGSVDDLHDPHEQFWRRIVRIEIVPSNRYGRLVGRVARDPAEP